MQLGPGVPLIGHVTCQKPKLYHGGFYECLHAIAEGVRLIDIETQEELWLPVKFLNKVRLGYAITMCACQGRTLRQGTVRIWDLSHPRITWQHLGVSLSRAVELSQVECV